MTSEELPAKREPFTEDEDFFPEKKPAGYPSFHNYRRDREAARLKAQGWTLYDIAENLSLFDLESGQPDERRAAAAVRRGLSMVHQFTVDEKRAEQLHSLELMKKHLWEQLNHQHVLVQQGRVIIHDDAPLEDRRFILETFDRLHKIEATEMDLLGTKSTTRLSIEADQIGGEITSLIALINGAGSETTVERADQPASRPELEA